MPLIRGGIFVLGRDFTTKVTKNFTKNTKLSDRQFFLVLFVFIFSVRFVVKKSGRCLT
jgi:hypothetical protein